MNPVKRDLADVGEVRRCCRPTPVQTSSPRRASYDALRMLGALAATTAAEERAPSHDRERRLRNMDIGKIGVWTSYRPFGVERAGEAAKLVEQLGYGTWWVGGSPHVPDVRPVLEATSTLVAATGILNVWSNDPGETAAADAALRGDFPGRFMLGVGIGHREATSDYRKPLTTMRAFLDGLDASDTPPPVDERCLAALGPKML